MVSSSETVKSANKIANWILIVFSDTSKSVLLALFKSLISSKLEYSFPVWNPPLIRDVENLESTQHSVSTAVWVSLIGID